jgi:hypothetical protein
LAQIFSPFAFSAKKEDSMSTRAILSQVVLLVLLSASAAFAAWQNVAPGIDYQEFTLADPNHVYVARMDRATTMVIIDSAIATGILASGNEPVSAIATRYDDTFGYWQEEWGKWRYKVWVAINGSGFTGSPPSGGQIISGWYAKRFDEFDATGPVWQLDRDVWLGSCPRHRPEKNYVTLMPSATTIPITGINKPRSSASDLIIFTCHYARQTPSVSDGAEVLVEMLRPAMVLPPPSYAKGYVREIRPNQGYTPIPFDHVVLSAGSSAATTLLANVAIGSEVRISQEITHYLEDCNTGNSLDWSKTYASCRYMTWKPLKNGVVDSYPSEPDAQTRRARTAFAYNDDYIFFVVVDEISGSIGMNMGELGTFCLNYLGATWADGWRRLLYHVG